MTFRLEKKTSNQLQTTFHVINGKGDLCGSINVKNSEADDLLRCWTGTAPAANAGKQPSAVAALSAAFQRAKPRMSKAGILRGCNG